MKRSQAVEEQAKNFSQDCASTFEEGVYSFLYSTWLKHPTMDFSFLESKYADQIAEWNDDPSVREEGLRARASEDETSSAPTNDAIPYEDPPTEDGPAT